MYRIRSRSFQMLACLVLATTACAGDMSLPANAEAVTPLQTGDMAPAFTVRTVDNQPYRFEPDALERPTILITFRGGWCPYCNLHLSELHTVIPDIRKLGYDILFLSGDRPDQLYTSLKRETQETIAGLDYTILSDADIDAARALGTAFRVADGMTGYLDSVGRDYAGSSIADHGALSVPAVFVVNRNGRIVYDFVNPDYKVRLSADKLLAAAQKAAQ